MKQGRASEAAGFARPVGGLAFSGAGSPLGHTSPLTQHWAFQGGYTEAEPLYQRALAIREHALEPHHPETAETLHGLATLRERQGDPQEAASLYHRALAIREEVYGPQHPKTTETRERLRAVLVALDRDHEAAGLNLTQLEQAER